MTLDVPGWPATKMRRTPLRAVAAVYGVQGMGYAVVVTAIPSFQERLTLSTTAVSAILLGVCIAAAIGSVLADAIAVRASSRKAVVIGLLVQPLGLAACALTDSLPVFVAAIAVYGLGLGVIDAASNMQGVIAERRAGRPLLGRCFAVYTIGAILGAIGMSLAIALSGAVVVALLLVALLQVLVMWLGSRHLDSTRAAERAHGTDAPRDRIPLLPVVTVGIVVLAAFTVDSGVSTWSSVHLANLGAGSVAAPLGYAAYQAGVLSSRLGTDALTRRLGGVVLAVAAVAAGLAGGLLVGLSSALPVVTIGFVLSGLAVGVLVPLGFAAAGRILPARSDEVIARVNLFNYIGAVLGAVGVGVLIDTAGATVAFLLPAVILLGVLFALRPLARTATP